MGAIIRDRGRRLIVGRLLLEGIRYLRSTFSGDRFVRGQSDKATEGNDKKRSFTTQRSFTFSEH